MSEGHVIEECRMELAFGTEAAALDAQPRWDTLLRRRFLPAVASALDTASVPGRVFRIDCLAVDLGEVGPTTSDAELEARLRERLAATLRDALSGFGPGASAVEAVTAVQSDLDCLRHFLVTGRLPWHGGPGRSGDLDRLARRVVDGQAGALVRWLRSRRAPWREASRLVRQFPPDVTARLLDTLMPPRDGMPGVLALAGRLQDVFASSVPGHTAAEHTRWVREALLLCALDPACPRRDAGGFVRAAFRRAARMAGADDGATARVIRAALSRVRGLPAGEDDHDGTATWLRRATGQGPATDGRAAGRVIRRVRWLAARLDESLLTGESVRILPVWRELVRTHGALVVARLRRHGVAAVVRRRLAERFPEPVLRDILQLLEPVHAGFVEEVVSRPELVSPAGGAREAAPETVRRRLWEFTLTYLIVDRGGRFNRQAYVAGVLRQMAVRDNLDFEALVTALTGALEAVEQRDPLQAEMLDLLHGLARSSEGRGVAVLPAAGAHLVEGASARAAIGTALRRLRRGGVVAAGPLARSIDLLASAGPPHWLQFVVALRRDVAGAVALARALDTPTLRRLVSAIASPEDTAGDGASEFARALAMHAARARDAHAFLVEVLRQVLRGQSVDLEALLGAAPRLDPAAPRADPTASGPVGGAGASGGPARRATVRAALDAWLSGGEVTAVIPFWPGLVRHHPALVRQTLRRVAAGARPAHLVATATDTMLRDIVHVLAPGQSGFLTELAHRPELFRHDAAVPADPAPMRRRVWTFTLTYLLVERGSQFNRAAYVRSLLRQMAAHDNLAVTDLVAAFVQVLERISQPDPLQSSLLAILRDLRASEGRGTGAAPPGVAGPPPAGRESDPRAGAPQPGRRPRHARRAGTMTGDDRVSPADGAPGHPSPSAAASRARGQGGRATDAARERPRPRNTTGTAPGNEPVTVPATAEAAVTVLAILSRLREGARADAPMRRRLVHALDRALARLDGATRVALMRSLEDRLVAQALAAWLPEPLLVRLFAVLRPQDHARILHGVELLVTALLGLADGATAPRDGAAGPPGPDADASPLRDLSGDPARLARWKWRFLLRRFVVEGRAFDAVGLVRAFCGALRALGVSAAGIAAVPGWLQRAAAAGARLDRGWIEAIARALDRADIEPMFPAASDGARTARRRVAGAGGADAEAELDAEPDAASLLERDALFVLNAGQVLAAPYLPRLFAMVDLLADGRFRDAAAAERAVHLLQFMVDGSTGAAETALALNKILCGIDLATPIARDIVLTDRERTAVEGLIGGMIANWAAIGRTSVAGMRESFLQREGRLARRDEGWQLFVEPRAFDMLLDRLPWSYAMIRLPWMAGLLQVDWR